MLHDCEQLCEVLYCTMYYELAMKVPIPVGITVYLLTWGLGHLRCLVYNVLPTSSNLHTVAIVYYMMNPGALKGNIHPGRIAYIFKFGLT